MTGSIRLFRLAGVEVGIHPSWFIVFGLVTWSLATNYFPAAIRGRRAITRGAKCANSSSATRSPASGCAAQDRFRCGR